MLEWNLRAVLADRGEAHPLRWLRRRDISYPRATSLLNGEASELKRVQVSAICRSLLCTPNDILVWREDADTLPPHHPLLQLAGQPNRLGVGEQLHLLDMNDMRMVQQLIEELLKRKLK